MTVKGMLKSQLLQEDEDMYSLSYELMKSFIDPSVQRIQELIDKQLADNANIAVIFLVGGFAESPYLKNIIESKYNKDGRIVATPRQC